MFFQWRSFFFHVTVLSCSCQRFGLRVYFWWRLIISSGETHNFRNSPVSVTHFVTSHFVTHFEGSWLKITVLVYFECFWSILYNFTVRVSKMTYHWSVFTKFSFYFLKCVRRDWRQWNYALQFRNLTRHPSYLSCALHSFDEIIRRLLGSQ